MIFTFFVLLISAIFFLTGRWTILYLTSLLFFWIAIMVGFWAFQISNSLALLGVGLIVGSVLTAMIAAFHRWLLPVLSGFSLLIIYFLVTTGWGIPTPGWWLPLLVYLAGIIFSYIFPKLFSSLFASLMATVIWSSTRGILDFSNLDRPWWVLLVAGIGFIFQLFLLPRFEAPVREGMESASTAVQRLLDPFHSFPNKRTRIWMISAVISVFFLIVHISVSLFNPISIIPPEKPYATRFQNMMRASGWVIGKDNNRYLTNQKIPFQFVSLPGQLSRFRFLVGGIPILDNQVLRSRAVKDSVEIGFISRACEITGESLLRSIPLVRPGTSEKELTRSIEDQMHQQGADPELAFPSIVASGKNAVILHYSKAKDILKEGELLVVDIGCKVNGYASDMTRTLPVSGRFTPEQREYYDVVLGAQKAALDSVREGISLGKLHSIAIKYLKGKKYNQYFVHQLSHHVGLNVHDPASLDLNLPLKEGMVITVEPGIYIKEKGIGIRIEDTIVVTKNGYRNLTNHFPKEADKIENLLQTLKAHLAKF